MTDNDIDGGSGESSADRSNGESTSRRRFLRATAGTGVLVAGVGLGLGSGIGSAAVTNATITTGDVVSGGGENEATISYGDGTFVVDGRIGASNPCHTAQLGDVRVEDGVLFVVVETEPVPTFAPCEQVLASVEYTAEVVVDEQPSRAVVQHSGTTDWQTEWSAGTTTTPAGSGPGVPTNVTATSVSPSSISLAWNAPADTGAGIDHYELQVFWTDVAVAFTATGTSVTLDGSHQHVSVSPGTTYEIQLRAIDSAGNGSDWTDRTSVTTPQPDDTVAPTTPSNLAATVLGSSSVDLAWDSSSDTGGSGLSHYEVTVSDLDNSEIADERQVSAGTTATTIDGLAAGTLYAFHVSAVDGTGNASALATVEATTDAAGSAPPPIDGAVPHDLDGDGIYEDVNGNNRTDSDDVVTYFQHMSSPEIANNTAAYDYNENGRIDFDDLVTLFESL